MGQHCCLVNHSSSERLDQMTGQKVSQFFGHRNRRTKFGDLKIRSADLASSHAQTACTAADLTGFFATPLQRQQLAGRCRATSIWVAGAL